MKAKRLAVAVFILSILLSGTLVAQEQKPSIFLSTFEKCNNYARHFCLIGSHEAAVNRALLDMKRKGYRITPDVIKNIARSTPSRMRNPVAGQTN